MSMSRTWLIGSRSSAPSSSESFTCPPAASRSRTSDERSAVLSSAIATQRHLHMAPREGGQQVGRDDGSVPERLVEKGRELGNEVEQHRWLEGELVMVGAQMLGNLPCIPRFIERALREPDRKALHLGAELGHHRGHRARVDAARKKDPERDIADQLLAHRLAQHRPQLFALFVEAAATRSVFLFERR